MINFLFFGTQSNEIIFKTALALSLFHAKSASLFSIFHYKLLWEPHRRLISKFFHVKSVILSKILFQLRLCLDCYNRGDFQEKVSSRRWIEGWGSNFSLLVMGLGGILWWELAKGRSLRKLVYLRFDKRKMEIYESEHR